MVKSLFIKLIIAIIFLVPSINLLALNNGQNNRVTIKNCKTTKINSEDIKNYLNNTFFQSKDEKNKWHWRYKWNSKPEEWGEVMYSLSASKAEKHLLNNIWTIEIFGIPNSIIHKDSIIHKEKYTASFDVEIDPRISADALSTIKWDSHIDSIWKGFTKLSWDDVVIEINQQFAEYLSGAGQSGAGEKWYYYDEKYPKKEDKIKYELKVNLLVSIGEPPIIKITSWKSEKKSAIPDVIIKNVTFNKINIIFEHGKFENTEHQGYGLDKPSEKNSPLLTDSDITKSLNEFLF